MLYKNISLSVKTFYGTEFKPGETHEVPGYVNDTKMIVVDKKPTEPPKPQKKSAEQDVANTSTESQKESKPIKEEK